MGDNKKTPITINGTDHFIEDLTEQQQMMVNHIADLDRKIRSTQFNLDQLTVGKDAFVNMLTASLATETEVKDYYDMAHPAQTETETK